MNLNTIFFIGPQGSGKGTQATLLAKKLGFYHWDMGGILRDTGKQDSDLGREVKDLIDRGVLLDDELLLKVARAKLETITPETGVVFDGIPRRIGQAEFLIGFLRSQGRKDFATVFLDIPKTETLKRLLLRAQTQGRADDTQEAIEFRLQQYYDDTLPVLEYLKNESTFYTIDGLPTIAEVTENINSNLEIR